MAHAAKNDDGQQIRDREQPKVKTMTDTRTPKRARMYAEDRTQNPNVATMKKRRIETFFIG